MIDSMAGAMAAYMVVCAVFAVLWLAIWIWALVDALRNPTLTDTMRLVWMLVIIFAPVIGALLYLVMARSRGAKPIG